MNLTERQEALKNIQSSTPFATGFQLLYRGQLSPFDVWAIPLDALIYNQYNGRIGSVVKSFEKSSHTLNPEQEEDIALIEKFLWESKENANEKTLNSLRETGQIKFGIVTSDGVIIDGNRRASLMNRIRRDPRTTQQEKDRCSFFKAVILPETATKREILQLETSFQMGEDAKVDYNPIEKYLKCRDLVEENFARNEIAAFMGIDKREVDLNLEILELMDKYLAFYEYDGLYTMAEKHEDSFQKLNSALKSYKAGVANMWDYTDEDINNLLCVSFDYIRLGLPQDDIRDIFRKPSGRNDSIFGSKDRWNRFFNKHVEILSEIEETPVEDYVRDATGTDLTKALRARDEDWRKQVQDALTDQMSSAKDEIDSQLQSNAPVILINKALGALNSINSDSNGFNTHRKEIECGLAALASKIEDLKIKLND